MPREFDDITYDKRKYNHKPISIKPLIFLLVLAIIGVGGLYLFQQNRYLIDDRMELKTFYSHLAESAGDAYPAMMEFKEFKARFDEAASESGADYEMMGINKASRGAYELHSKRLTSNTVLYFTTAPGSYDIRKIAILSSSKGEFSMDVLVEALGITLSAISEGIDPADIREAQSQVQDAEAPITHLDMNGIKCTFVNSTKLYWVEINR